MRNNYTRENNMFHRFGTDNYYKNRANHASRVTRATTARANDAKVVGYDRDTAPNIFTDTFYRNLRRDNDGGSRFERFDGNGYATHNDYRGNYRADRDGYVDNGHVRAGMANHAGHRFSNRIDRTERTERADRNHVTNGNGVSRRIDGAGRVHRGPISRNAPAATSSAITRSSATPSRYNHNYTRTTRGIYRNTATESRNATITFVVLLVAIGALLALAIYALMRPRHDKIAESRVSDNESANRRR
jgi:hypothetical protein